MLLWTISSLVSQLGLIMKYLINNSQNIFKHSFNLKVVHKHQLYNEHCNINFFSHKIQSNIGMARRGKELIELKRDWKADLKKKRMRWK